MLFNSYLFLFLFLPLMVLGYFSLLKYRWVMGSKVWLVGGSLFFYGYWSVLYVPLLLGSILVNFFVGSALMDRSSAKKEESPLYLKGFL